MEIKVVKKKTAYTFIEDNMSLELDKNIDKTYTSSQKGRLEFRLREDDANPNINLKHESKLSGGHGL